MDSTTSVWVSDTLALDFNLRMKITPPVSLAYQIFFLAVGKPPVLFSCYGTNNKPGCSVEQDIEDVKDYTVKMAQRLKMNLTKFCTFDFAIVRFTLDIADFSLDKLLKAVRKELEFTRKFFRGTVDLSAKSYVGIKKAVEALVSGSHIPCLLRDEEHDEASLLLLDKPWCDGLSLATEELNEGEISYPPNAGFKVKVAALEAATRHSYNKRVIISSPHEHLQDIVRRIKEQAKQDFDPEPDLVVEKAAPSGQKKGWTSIVWCKKKVEHQLELLNDSSAVGPMTSKEPRELRKEEDSHSSREKSSSKSESSNKVHDAFTKLISFGKLSIIGPPKTGKSELAKSVLRLCEEQKYDPIVIHTKHDWNKLVRKNKKQAIFLEDIRYSDLEGWKPLLNEEQSASPNLLLLISVSTSKEPRELQQLGFPLLNLNKPETRVKQKLPKASDVTAADDGPPTKKARAEKLFWYLRSGRLLRNLPQGAAMFSVLDCEQTTGTLHPKFL